MKIIDKAISAVSPKWAARRAEQRFKLEVIETNRAIASHFAAAERTRLTADWPSTPRSADGSIVPDLATLNARARNAVDNDWAASSVAQAYRRHIVGIGITARSNARDPETEQLLDEFNRKADRLWNRWARKARYCDIERKKSLVEITGLAVNEFIAVGQAFAAWSYERRPETVGLKIQLFEPEQLALELLQAENGNWIRNGIEIDAFGAPVAYWVYLNDHPLDGFGRRYKPTRIPADRVFHLMRQNRIRQTHGVTRLAPVLHKLRHLERFDEYNLVAARLQACASTWIKTNDNAEDPTLWGMKGDDSDTGTDANGNRQLNMEPGAVNILRKGEEPLFYAPKSPGEFYDPFTRRQLHQIAAGAGLDYPTVSRDFSGNTFSGQRQGMLERDDETDPLQLLVIDQLLRPIRDIFMMIAILEGRLPAPNFFSDSQWAEEYLEAEWQGPPKEWIDPANQATAAEKEVKLGVNTRRRILNMRCMDWRETIQQLGDEERLADQIGVNIGGSGPQATSPVVQQQQPNIPANSPAPDQTGTTQNNTNQGSTLRLEKVGGAA